MSPHVKARYEELRRKVEARCGEQPHFRSPKWAAALEAVWSLLPTARDRIKAPWNLSPVGIAEAADAMHLAFKVIKVERWWEHETGPGIYEKLELFDMMFAGRQLPHAETFFIPDCCFSGGEPFLPTGDTLRSCVAACCSFVFDADTLFICPAAHLISCFHHEGAYWHIDCRLEVT